MTDDHYNRMTEIKDVHHRFADVYKIGGGIMLVLVGVWIGALLFTDGYATNLYTEVLSIVVTVLVLDRLQERRNTEQRKEILRREAGSRDNSTALNSMDWLRAENWLTIHDEIPLLRHKKLARANLHDAYLYEADLEKTNLYKADLSNATLGKAKFYDAFFNRAILDGASVYETDFRQAVLWDASLKGVRYIETALFDEGTVLPNAQPLYDENGNHMKNDKGHFIYDTYWTADTDMTRYTDPDHPDFWQPQWLQTT